MTYSTKTQSVSQKPAWDTLVVSIYQGYTKIGEYNRNYHTLYNTFYPFTLDGKDYAIYSPDYTCTRIMELPSCKDIGGEEPKSWGFCPVDYYIPRYMEWHIKGMTSEDMDKQHIPEKNRCWVGKDRLDVEYLVQGEKAEAKDEHDFAGHKTTIKGPFYAKFGFVAGCVWGDDSSWKIQYLDLTDCTKGILKRDDRFGYLEKPHGLSLEEAVQCHENCVAISSTHYYKYNGESSG